MTQQTEERTKAMEDIDTIICKALKLIDEWEEEKTRKTADLL